MSCCGRGAASDARPTLAMFRYEGDAPITVIGPATGRQYRFEMRGAEVAVDILDRKAVRHVPRLRELRVV